MRKAGNRKKAKVDKKGRARETFLCQIHIIAE
jgi:hypothetical protein